MEAEADCLGVQLDAHVATALGADMRFARAMAREFWTDFYRTRTDGYWSPKCRNGGPLDLFPNQQGWPTPSVYPADLSARISGAAATAG